MKYVNMNEVAYDANQIVFPGLGNCHGVVLQTNNGLFGFHIAGSDLRTTNKAPYFAQFVQNHPNGGNGVGVRLYGVCPDNRYPNGVTGHRAELQEIANALGFNGPIEGAMWSMQQMAWGTTYVDCSLNGSEVWVRIENFTAAPIQTGANLNPVDQQRIDVQTAPGFGVQPTVNGSVTAPPTVVTGVTRINPTPSYLLTTHVL